MKVIYKICQQIFHFLWRKQYGGTKLCQNYIQSFLMMGNTFILPYLSISASTVPTWFLVCRCVRRWCRIPLAAISSPPSSSTLVLVNRGASRPSSPLGLITVVVGVVSPATSTATVLSSREGWKKKRHCWNTVRHNLYVPILLAQYVLLNS